jgi:Protein of unknown function (DUF3309)
MRPEMVPATQILIGILVAVLLGVMPGWTHARTWGYRPSSAIGIVILVLVVLLLTGRI